MKNKFLRIFLLILAAIQGITNIHAQWTAVATGTNDWVLSLATYNSELYAAGRFTTADGMTENKIAKWNGTSWSAVGTGLGPVSGATGALALAVYKNELYVGGLFSTAGGVATANIAKWNGSTWSAVSSATNDQVSALGVYNGELYAAGKFTSIDGVNANRIAKWNGSAWSVVGAGLNKNVITLCVYGTDLYAGGSFDSTGVIPAKGIAKWNGSAWSDVGGGLTPYGARGMVVYNSELVVGGPFAMAGSNAANCIAKWNGVTWSTLGTGMAGSFPYVYSLGVLNSELYAGGNFSTAGGTAVINVAKWNGSSWSAMGAGLNSDVDCFAIYNSELYAGGMFTLSGTGTMNHIAKFIGPLGINENQSNAKATIFPNPSLSGLFTLSLNNAVPQTAIIIYNILGEVVYQSAIEQLSAKSNNLTINLEGQPAGIYFSRVFSGTHLISTEKLIISK